MLCHTICRKVLVVRLRCNRNTLCQLQLMMIAAPHNMRQDLEWLVMCVAATCAVFSTCLAYVLCHTICRKVLAVRLRLNRNTLCQLQLTMIAVTVAPQNMRQDLEYLVMCVATTWLTFRNKLERNIYSIALIICVHGCLCCAMSHLRCLVLLLHFSR